MKRTVILVILDGFGIGLDNETNPFYVVNPENFRRLAEEYPVTSLQASGISVGLPWGETGNSEVGHLTIGAGKVVYQYYPKIMMAIQDETFFENEALKGAFAHAKKNNSSVNFVGLLSKANTHAALDHLHALLKMAEHEGVDRVKLHIFADGKDSPPRTLQDFLKEIPTEKMGTLIGRYYAMNRNQNWQLTQRAYECLTGKSGTRVADPAPVIEETYTKGLSEEYLPPLQMEHGLPIEENDAVVFFNYREDSMRQLGEAFLLPGFDKFPTKPMPNAYFVMMTRYENRLTSPVAFAPDEVEHPLGFAISQAGKAQIRIAETYKYAHVTYFFNGHREPPFPGEYRVLIPSLNISQPEDRPELMASVITDRLLEALENRAFDFILVNYANADTIGHTGNYQAALETVRVLDRELGRVMKVVEGTDTLLIVTSDHGNVEEMVNPVSGAAETQHDPNPVPFYLVGKEFRGRKFANAAGLSRETTGILSDVAPTVLELMQIPIPPDMTGKSLLRDLLRE